MQGRQGWNDVLLVLVVSKELPLVQNMIYLSLELLFLFRLPTRTIAVQVIEG